MSYAITDAGESDMLHELKALDELAENIDQLEADARDCDTLAPEVKTLLQMAWYFAEKALREANGHCSAKCNGRDYCACCSHFNKLRNRAENIRRIL